MHPPRRYYPLWFRLAGQDGFLLWYSDTEDGVLTREGRLLGFASLAQLGAYAAQHQLLLDPDPPLVHDLDFLRGWLTRRPGALVSPAEYEWLLDGWNLFSDCATSIQQTFEPPWANTLYRKLFWGANLPSLTPPGAVFRPRWSRREWHRLRLVLRAGLGLFRRHLLSGSEVAAPGSR